MKEELLAEKERLEHSVIELYKRYRAGNISKDSYMSERFQSKEKISQIEEKLRKADEIAESTDMDSCMVRVIPDEYDAGIMSEIIEKVIVYDRKRIEVVFKCNDVHKEVCFD